MANVNAFLNQIVQWSPAVIGDTLTCNVNEHIRRGIQIEANGFNLETATVKAIAATGAEKTVSIESGTGEIAVIGDEDFRISQIVISGITGGPYPVRISQ